MGEYHIMKLCVIILVGSVFTSGREDRQLLNIFNVVRFPNDACTTSGNTNGVCYSASECRAKGGNGQGTCASGFGVCCSFTGSCGGSTMVNNTYFASGTAPTSPCMFSVCKIRDDICQIRLNFDEFSIAQPNTKTLQSLHPQGRTQCQKAQFMASSAGPASPVICGTNQGYHMIIEASNDCNMLSFNWITGATPNTWNIHIMQIPCDAKWKPPAGCLQYFTGITGYMQTYNYAGGIHLANQDYNNCIRTERNYCSIKYSQVATDFSLSSTTATTSVTGDTCTDDYVVIHGGGPAVNVGANFERFCGTLLAGTNGAVAATTVFTQRMPFEVGVVTNGAEVDAAAAPTEASGGFYMYYDQTAC